MSVWFVISILVWGFILGGIARFAVPGPDPMPAWLTAAIGLAGAIIGALISRGLFHTDSAIGILAFVFATALVIAYRHFVQKRPVFGPGAFRFPERGIGVADQREKLRKLGIDPDAPALGLAVPQNTERRRLEAMLDELHRSGVLTDEELEAKREQLSQSA